jgi:MoaA/NifB/PqqE/SkfB family radical SAM enzyme
LRTKDENLPFSKFLEIVGKLPQIRGINIIGLGEPFLHPEWKKFCKYIEINKLTFDVTTNGTIMTDDIIDGLPKGAKVCFSLDSIRKSRLEANRKVDPDLVVRNIIKLVQKRKDLQIILQPVIVRGFSDEVKDYIKLAKMLNVRIHPILPALSSKEAFEELFPSDEEIKTIVEAFQTYNLFSPNVTVEPEFRVCGEPFGILLVNIDGTMYPCCLMNSLRYEGEKYVEFYKGKTTLIETDKYQLGNIYSNPLDGEKVLKIRNIIQQTSPKDFEDREKVSLDEPLNYCKICLSRWKRGC